MSVDDRYRRAGERPLKKILIGDNAGQHLHYAENKLQDMYRAGGPIQVHNQRIGDGTKIRIEKNATFDRITIDEGGYNWATIGAGSLLNPNGQGGAAATQFATATSAKGPWAEPPKYYLATAFFSGPLDGSDFYQGYEDNTGFHSDGYFFASRYRLSNGKMPLVTRPLLAIGDGRTAAAFDDARFYDVFKPDGKIDKFVFVPNNAVVGDAPGPLGPIFTSAFSSIVSYDAQIIWSKGLTDVIQAQIATFTLHPYQYSVGSSIFYYAKHRFNRITIDYVQLAGDPPLSPGETRFTILVDNTMEAYYGYGVGYPEWLFLTPDRIHASHLYSSPDTSRYDAVSIDGGVSWTYHSYDSADPTGPLVGGNSPLLSFTRYAALNSTSALRVTLRLAVPTVAGVIDTTKFVIERVDIFGGVMHLYDVPRFDSDTSIASIGPGTPDMNATSFFNYMGALSLDALGRDCYVLRLIYKYVLREPTFTDPGDGSHTPLDPGLYTFRCKSMRTYDGGVSWDDPVDEGFDIHPPGGFYQEYIVGRDGLTDGSPRLTHNVYIYPHKPRTATDPGVVYQLINQTSTYVQSDLFPGFFSPTGSFLYKSVDQCRTWQRVSKVANKQTSLPPFKPTARFSYYNVIDKNAPIDPVFPWRVDARFTPPDWW